MDDLKAVSELTWDDVDPGYRNDPFRVKPRFIGKRPIGGTGWPAAPVWEIAWMKDREETRKELSGEKARNEEHLAGYHRRKRLTSLKRSERSEGQPRLKNGRFSKKTSNS